MRLRPSWPVPAWYARPAPRLLFQRRLSAYGMTVRAVRPARPHQGGYAVALHLDVPDLEPQRVTIVFGRFAPAQPHVFTTGPSSSPHRYPDNSLCMWYPEDPLDRRWSLRDGPGTLLGQIVAHLLREEWWRRTGEWPGEEVEHLLAPSRPGRTHAA